MYISFSTTTHILMAKTLRMTLKKRTSMELISYISVDIELDMSDKCNEKTTSHYGHFFLCDIHLYSYLFPLAQNCENKFGIQI